MPNCDRPAASSLVVLHSPATLLPEKERLERLFAPYRRTAPRFFYPALFFVSGGSYPCPAGTPRSLVPPPPPPKPPIYLRQLPRYYHSATLRWQFNLIVNRGKPFLHPNRSFHPPLPLTRSVFIPTPNPKPPISLYQLPRYIFLCQNPKINCFCFYAHSRPLPTGYVSMPTPKT